MHNAKSNLLLHNNVPVCTLWLSLKFTLKQNRLTRDTFKELFIWILFYLRLIWPCELINREFKLKCKYILQPEIWLSHLIFINVPLSLFCFLLYLELGESESFLNGNRNCPYLPCQLHNIVLVHPNSKAFYPAIVVRVHRTYWRNCSRNE